MTPKALRAMNPNLDLLEVFVYTPKEILFEGKASSVIFPGEKGVFEVLPQHKPLLSRILRGEILVDGQSIPIRRGVVKVALNRVAVIVENGLD